MAPSTKSIRLAIAAALVGILCGLGGVAARNDQQQTVTGKPPNRQRAANNDRLPVADFKELSNDNRNNRRRLEHEPTPDPTSVVVMGEPRQIGPGATDEPTGGSLTPEPTMAATGNDNVNQMILEEFEEMVAEEIEPVEGTLVVAGTDPPTPRPTPAATQPERVTDEPTGADESKSSR